MKFDALKDFSYTRAKLAADSTVPGSAFVILVFFFYFQMNNLIPPRSSKRAVPGERGLKI
jgi:hypothetical protein